MFEEISIRYFHPRLNVGLQDIKNAGLLNDVLVKLFTAPHRGSLVYRMPGSGKRISYRTLKKKLIKKESLFNKNFF